MKRYIKVLISIAAFSIVTVSNVIVAGMAGGKHDLTTLPTDPGYYGICGYCHSGAHSPEGSILGLWDRTEITTVFTLYSSPTLDSTGALPGSVSLLCLSCHDGVTAFDALGESAGTPDNNMNTLFPGSLAIMGDDLRNDHPIGVDITLDPAIRGESFITSGGLMLFDNKVECPSCHAVHGETGFEPFLWIDPSSSALCWTCHIK